MSFESISNLTKLRIRKACEVATFFQSFAAKNQKEYDIIIDWQYDFVSHILSLPTILRYAQPSITKLNIKNLLASFYFVQANSNRVIPKNETEKDTNMMFIFGNVFELLHSYIVPES